MNALDLVLFVAMGLVAARQVLLLVAALVHVARSVPAPLVDGARVSIVIPAHQEEKVIAAAVRKALASERVDFEVIVVDDGSTDGTSAELARIADRRLRVLRHETNRGKAAALNTGLAAASAPIVVTADADTHLLPDTALKLAAALSSADAVAGNLKVGNHAHWLGAWQRLEYVVGMNLDRRAQATLNAVTTIPGAVGAYRKQAVEAVGGWSGDTVTEDTDLAITLLRRGYRVIYAPEAVAYTEAPSTTADLLRQRVRWIRGYHQNLVKHAGMLTSGGVLAWFAWPNLLFTHVLAFLFCPLNLAWLPRVPIWMPWTTFAALVAIGFTLDLLVCVAAVVVDKEDARQLVHAPLQRLCLPIFLWFAFARSLWPTRRWLRVQRTGSLNAETPA